MIITIILTEDNDNKISSNKNSDDTSNNNNLKDWQNDRLESKKTLIKTRDWSGLYAFEEYSYYT